MTSLMIRAEFDKIRAVPDSIGPALEITIGLVVSSNAPSGAWIEVPQNSKHISVLDLKAHLYWIVRQGKVDTACLVGEGSCRLGTPRLFLDGNKTGMTIVFQMSREQLDRIEDFRAGGKPRLKVTLQMLLLCDGKGIPDLSSEFDVLHGTQPVVEIEKSKWVEEVLPGLNYGEWKLIEIPFVKVPDGLSKVDETIEEAQTKYGLGDWAGCLTSCRIAMEDLAPHAKALVNPVHTDKRGGSAEEKMEELIQEFEGLCKSMADLQRGVRKMLAAGPHRSDTGAVIERADAELGLHMVTAIRRYVGIRALKAGA